MKKSKIFILLFTLSFPVITYLFLRFFGQNEFALPVFFENEEKIRCDEVYIERNLPFVFQLNSQDSLMIQDVYKTDFKVIHFPDVQDSEVQRLKNELNRVLNTFGELSIEVLTFYSVSASNTRKTIDTPFLSANNSRTFLYGEADKNTLVNCLYAFPTPDWGGTHPSEETIAVDHTVVLLDKDNKIRGYYDGYETKEVDRLILEIRVLMSNR